MENVIAQSEISQNVLDKSRKVNVQEEIFGEKLGLIARVFGCRHSRMSMPVTTKEITYRFCPTCGIRRIYDLETFRLQGSYYYPAHNEEFNYI